MNGVDIIAAERRRQVEAEGWTLEHDDEHGSGELALAGGCYAIMAGMSDGMRDDMRKDRGVPPSPPWPWDREWWKPGADNGIESRIRELAKAGALCAAEIDRLKRVAAASGPDFGDGCDHEGFPGGCERMGHTAETCPRKEGAQ